MWRLLWRHTAIDFAAEASRRVEIRAPRNRSHRKYISNPLKWITVYLILKMETAK